MTHQYRYILLTTKWRWTTTTNVGKSCKKQNFFHFCPTFIFILMCSCMHDGYQECTKCSVATFQWHTKYRYILLTKNDIGQLLSMLANLYKEHNFFYFCLAFMSFSCVNVCMTARVHKMFCDNISMTHQMRDTFYWPQNYIEQPLPMLANLTESTTSFLPVIHVHSHGLLYAW